MGYKTVAKLRVYEKVQVTDWSEVVLEKKGTAMVRNAGDDGDDWDDLRSV